MPLNPLIALAAGAASAVLFLAAVSGGALGLVLSLFLSPLPIAIIGLGWSWRTALLASGIAAAGLSLITPAAGLIHILAIGLPMSGFSYLLSLNREISDGQRTTQEWYPLGRVAGAIALWAGGISAVAIRATGGSVEEIKTALKGTIERFIETQGQIPGAGAENLTPERINQLTELMVQVLPAGTATIWTLIAVLNLYFGGKIAFQSGRLIRPWPDLTLTTVPRSLGLGFALAALVSFAGGLPGLIASCFIWAFAICFLFQGLAVIHQVTRGIQFRGGLLFTVYLALLLFNPFSGILIALIGIAEPISPMRRQMTEETHPHLGAPGTGPGAPPPQSPT